MTNLETLLADYRVGLDAELQVLAELEALAIRQQALPHPVSANALTAISAERERHLSTLNGLEARLLPLRQEIGARLSEVRPLPGFAGVAERHQRVGALVSRIMALDAETLAALGRADQERRAAAQRIEAGEATLAAYRRVVQQTPSAGLFDKRG